VYIVLHCIVLWLWPDQEDSFIDDNNNGEDRDGSGEAADNVENDGVADENDNNDGDAEDDNDSYALTKEQEEEYMRLLQHSKWAWLSPVILYKQSFTKVATSSVSYLFTRLALFFYNLLY